MIVVPVTFTIAVPLPLTPFSATGVRFGVHVAVGGERRGGAQGDEHRGAERGGGELEARAHDVSEPGSSRTPCPRAAVVSVSGRALVRGGADAGLARPDPGDDVTAVSPVAGRLARVTASTYDDALTVLRRLVGSPDAEFHDGQYEAIETLVDEHRRALVVQRTGWGKSAVYFVATMLLRARGAGPTVLVSPLLALMRDQVAAAERAGVRAVAINSTNAHEWDVAAGVAGRRRGRRAARLARAAEQPVVPRDPAARARRAARDAGGRRGALHQRLGPRLPARTTGACAT